MKKDELYANILGTSIATYYNYLKEDRSVIKFLNLFSLDELEEFSHTGKLKSLQHYRVWKNSSRSKISITNKIHNLLTGKNGEFIKNEKLISFVCELFISFRQMRNEGIISPGLEQIVWEPEEITFNQLYSLYLLTHSKGNLLEDISRDHTAKYIFEDLHNLLSITDDESHHLAYMMEDHLMRLVEWSLNTELIYIFQAKGLVILSLILMSADWHQDLEIGEVIKLALPDDIMQKINKTSSSSKLLKIYHEQVADLLAFKSHPS